MAVAFDAAGGPANATGATWTHTPAGTPAAVLVAVGSLAAGGTGSHIPSSVTYGASTMSLLASQLGDTANADEWNGLYGLLNPPGGAQTVTVTVSSASVAGASASYTGATAFGTAAGNPGSSTTAATAAVPSSSGNLVAGMAAAGTALSSANSPSTSRKINNASASFGNGNVGIADAPGTGSNVSWNWTVGGADDWATIAVEVQAAAGTAAPSQPYAFPQMRTELIPGHAGGRVIRS